MLFFFLLIPFILSHKRIYQYSAQNLFTLEWKMKISFFISIIIHHRQKLQPIEKRGKFKKI